jgi:hypothetical protein
VPSLFGWLSRQPAATTADIEKRLQRQREEALRQANTTYYAADDQEQSRGAPADNDRVDDAADLGVPSSMDEDDGLSDHDGVDRLGSQAAHIWRTWAPMIRERSHAEADDPADITDRLHEARDVLWDFAGALNDLDIYTNPAPRFWFHRRPDQVDGTCKIDRERIDRRWLLETIGRYLSHSWMQHPEIEWVALDSLIYAEIAAFREAILSGSLVGKANWAYALAAGDPLKATLLRTIGSIAGLLARYVIPAVVLWVLLAKADMQVMLVVAAIWGLYLLGRLAAWPRRRNIRKQQAAATVVLQKMVSAYGYCDPPVINPGVLRAHLETATEAGGQFDGAVFTILERLMKRDPSTFLPFAESSSIAG